MPKSSSLILIVAMLIVLLLSSLIVQLLYNYSIPKVVESISPNYSKANFRKINYGTAMAVLILCSMLFGSTVVIQKYVQN